MKNKKHTGIVLYNVMEHVNPIKTKNIYRSWLDGEEDCIEIPSVQPT